MKCRIWHQIGKEGSTMETRATVEELKAWVLELLEEVEDGKLLHRVYNLLVTAYRDKA